MVEEAPADSLEARLKSHQDSFNSLLSLIPAKIYYGEDTSDQWQRKKQTKEEARAAKRAKLDPDNQKSAKDVLDEQAAIARKRKREEEGDVSDVEGVEIEKPIMSSARKGKQTKKQKKEEKGIPTTEHFNARDQRPTAVQALEQDEEALRKEKAARKREKKERKKAKEEANAAKAKAKKEKRTREAALAEDSKAAAGAPDVSDEEEDATGGEIEPVMLEDIMEDVPSQAPSTATPSTNRSPALDAFDSHSGSSSISSIAPPTAEEIRPKADLPKNSNDAPTSKPSPEELKARLTQRIEALRAARNPSGDSPRNRQELMEQRRAKEEQRRAHKKDLRRQAKEEEERQRNETLARGSPLLSGSPLISPGSPLTPSSEPNNFSFGRVNFGDGQHAAASLNAILEAKTRPKGPSDPRTALLAAQNKQSRLNGLDEAKRADIAEKDTWLNARKRAHGERTRDDTSLLKKTLKRKEKQKKKSEKEWTERIEGVKKGQDFKQKKREANIQKRKEEKGGNKGKKSKGPPKKGKPKARPGFEGSFRAKAPSAANAGGGRDGQRRR